MKFTGEIGSCARPFSVIRVPQRHQPIRLRIRQRPQHHRIDHGEDGRGGAGAEAEHQHGDERKRRMLPELTHRQANRTHHVQAPSTGGARHQIGARGLDAIGMLRARGAASSENADSSSAASARVRASCGVGAVFERRGVEIFEMRDQLVDRRVAAARRRTSRRAGALRRVDRMTVVMSRLRGLDAGHLRAARR